jgi:hypothetical protein
MHAPTTVPTNDPHHSQNMSGDTRYLDSLARPRHVASCHVPGVDRGRGGGVRLIGLGRPRWLGGVHAKVALFPLLNGVNLLGTIGNTRKTGAWVGWGRGAGAGRRGGRCMDTGLERDSGRCSERLQARAHTPSHPKCSPPEDLGQRLGIRELRHVLLACMRQLGTGA